MILLTWLAFCQSLRIEWDQMCPQLAVAIRIAVQANNAMKDFIFVYFYNNLKIEHIYLKIVLSSNN